MAWGGVEGDSIPTCAVTCAGGLRFPLVAAAAACGEAALLAADLAGIGPGWVGCDRTGEALCSSSGALRSVLAGCTAVSGFMTSFAVSAAAASFAGRCRRGI